MLLGGAEYLAAFHDAYRAAGRHLKHGAWYIDVHTSTTAVTSPLFNSLQCAAAPARTRPPPGGGALRAAFGPVHTHTHTHAHTHTAHQRAPGLAL